MKILIRFITVFFVLQQTDVAKGQTTTTNSGLLVFRDGESQPVPEFSDRGTWIKEELWERASSLGS